MKEVDPDAIRALVRRALEQRLGVKEDRLGTARPTPGAVPPFEQEIASDLCEEGPDFSARRACLIEPHRLCSNSGYCRKLGY